jgi:hypothetical protein
MLLVLINVLIIVVVGALFVLGHRQVRSRWAASEPAQDPNCADLSRGDPPASAPSVRSGRAAVGALRDPVVMPRDGAIIFGDLIGKLGAALGSVPPLRRSQVKAPKVEPAQVRRRRERSMRRAMSGLGMFRPTLRFAQRCSEVSTKFGFVDYFLGSSAEDARA